MREAAARATIQEINKYRDNNPNTQLIHFVPEMVD